MIYYLQLFINMVTDNKLTTLFCIVTDMLPAVKITRQLLGKPKVINYRH